jgi:hypothetical protein
MSDSFWKPAYTWIVAGVGLVLLVIIVLGMYVSYNNKEVALRNQATAVQRDLHSQLDLVTKKISQTAQVTKLQMDSIKEIIIGNSQARGKSNGSLATLVHEAVPDIAPTTPAFTNLQNIIAGARDSYASKQTLLLDIKREHDNIIDKIPSGWFVGGRPKLEVQIVTSSRVEEAFRTGVDDDDSVFKSDKPKAVEK